MSVDGGVVAGNEAAGNGGGLAASGEATLVLGGGLRVEGNSAGQGGGGLFAGGGAASLGEVAVVGNQAGQVRGREKRGEEEEEGHGPGTWEGQYSR